MGAPLCHFEFVSDNPEKCKVFYSQVLGWTFDDCSMPGYTLINPGEQPNGGLMQRPPMAPKPALNAYFLVESIDATLTKVEQAGGRTIVPKMQIPNAGAFAMFLDPEGIAVGIYQR